MLGSIGATAEGPRAPARRLPRVLAYHKVTRFELGGTWVSAPRFIRQIDALLADGFHFIDEDSFLAALDGERTAGEREVLLTFDDGYLELLDHAIPALDERGIRALLFLVTDFVGKENTWELALPWRRAAHMGWTRRRISDGADSHSGRTRARTATSRGSPRPRPQMSSRARKPSSRPDSGRPREASRILSGGRAPRSAPRPSGRATARGSPFVGRAPRCLSSASPSGAKGSM